MRLHHLEIQNLNSLRGTQPIDFEKELAGATLFLIMGSTGAGKTTILDAICLALFGSTPRVRGEGGGGMAAKLPAERLMTTGTGECQSTLVFSLVDEQGIRQRYRATWRCHRARQRPDGKIQAPKRSLEHIHEDGTVDILVTTENVTDSDRVFSEVLRGMTEESFLRSVMLAQGQFSAFLHATEDVKAAILERLTKTEKYRQIGLRAQVVYKAKKEVVDDVKKSLELLPGMDGEALGLLEVEFDELAAQEIVKGANLGVATQRLDWFKAWRSLVEEVRGLGEAFEVAKEEGEAHQADFERLARARRARPVDKLLTEVDRLVGEEQKLIDGLPDLREAAQRAEGLLKEGLASLELVSKLHGEAKAAYEARVPELNEARKVRQQVRDGEEQLKKLVAVQKQAADELEAYEKALGEARAWRVEALGERDLANQRLGEVEGFAGLVESLSGLTSSYERLDELRQTLAKGRKKLESRQSEVKELEGKRDRLREALDVGRAGLEPLEEAWAGAKAQLEGVLGAASSVVEGRKNLREQLDELRERRIRGQEARKLAFEFGGLNDELRSLGGLSEGFAARLEGLDGDVAACEELVEARSKVVIMAEDSLDLIKQSLALTTQRQMLKEGDACPLCGSEEHPLLASGSHHEADARLEERGKEFDAALVSARRELKDGEVRLSALKTDRALLLQSIEETAGKRLGLEQQRDQTQEALTEALVLAKMNVEQIDEALVALDESIEEVQRSSESLDAAEANEREAVEALRHAREALVEFEQQMEKVDLEASKTAEQIRELDDELEAMQTRAGIEEDELVLALEGLGIAIAPDEGLKGGLKEASAMRKAYVDARDGADKAAQAVLARQAEVSAAEGQVQDAKPRHERAKNDQESGEKEVEALRLAAAASLDGADPDTVEMELKGSIARAEEALKLAQDARGDASEAFKVATLALEQANARRAVLEQELKVGRSDLDAGLVQCGFSDVDEVRAALLKEEEFAVLEEKIEGLKQNLTRAKDQLESATKRLEAHREAVPEGLDVERAMAETLEEEKRIAQAEHAELQQGLGKLKERLDASRGELLRRRELEEERGRLERDLEVWKDIQNLIGSNNGGAFQRYAQALNLRELVQRANTHLDKLTDRYHLEVAGDLTPRLEFEVLDGHHAGQARPLSTLSGGEVFLVSLAMALALADSQQLNLKMETLLLDEGFGTLDPESLSTALNLLKNLHLDGDRQVGLISHVDGLKERIPHRIHVQALGDGNSKIEVLGPSDG